MVKVWLKNVRSFPKMLQYGLPTSGICSLWQRFSVRYSFLRGPIIKVFSEEMQENFVCTKKSVRIREVSVWKASIVFNR